MTRPTWTRLDIPEGPDTERYRANDGRFARVDLAFPGQRLAVEYGGEWHGEWLHVGRDRERLNRLHAAGWEVVFVTAQHLRNPQHMVRTVRAALGRRT